jgi:outer membrane protein assembly factor BamE
MTIRILFTLALSALLCGGCGLIYKQNIQQGNALEQDDLDELYIGMNQRQVLFVLGTPSIKDPFHQDRWDYVQTFSRRGSDLVQRTVTLRFEDGVLAEIIGQQNDLTSPKDSGSAGTGEVASFVKKPAAETDPHKAAVESAEEEVLSKKPDIDTVKERNSEDRDYKPDVLDQTPEDGPISPDIDG